MALQVRRSNYRGREGWLICGYNGPDRGGWPTRVFVEGDREYAQRVKARIQAGVDDIFSDEEHADA